MKLKTTLILSSILTAGLAVSLTIVVLWTNYLLDDAATKATIASELSKGALQLHILTNDYLTHSSERAQAQWLSQYALISQIIDSSEFSEKLETPTVLHLRSEHEKIKSVFDQLVENQNAGLPDEFSEHLSNQLSIHSQTLSTESFQLVNKALANNPDITKTSGQLVLIIPLIFIGGMFGSIIFSNRIIIKSINPKVLNSHNEIGDLARTLDKMKYSIKNYTKRLQDFKRALDDSSVVAITDKNGTITYVNDYFCKISKYSKNELIGQNHRLLQSGYHSDKFYKDMLSVIRKGHVWKGDIKHKTKYDSYYWVRTVIVPLLGDDGLPEQYISILTDITTQKETEEQLEESLEVIKKSDVLKEEFAAMVTHELKTPLTPIKGYCEILKDPDLIGNLNSEQLSAVQEIEDNSNRLEQLISDVLDAQKIDMNKMKFNKKQFQVDGFMTAIMNNYLPLMKATNIDFTNHTNTNFVLTSDPSRLEQILSNLIKNAIDFVPQERGKIEIGAHQQNSEIIFYVKDNGIGITKTNQKHLFKKFYQIDTSITRKHGGTGLGLSICHGIVSGLGGMIWADSELGKGTIFYFSIPIEIKLSTDIKLMNVDLSNT